MNDPLTRCQVHTAIGETPVKRARKDWECFWNAWGIGIPVNPERLVVIIDKVLDSF